MSIWDSFRNFWSSPAYGTGSGSVMLFGMPTTIDDLRSMIQGQDPAQLYRQQPNLRTMVSFLARNTAQLGVHTFKRIGDTDRERNRTDKVAVTLQYPNKTMTQYDLIYRLVADLSLWDEALLLVTQDIEARSGWTIQPIPMTWVKRFKGGDLWGPDTVCIYPPGAKKEIEVPMDDVIHFHGWDPANLHSGVSPIESLKATISEQIHAFAYREQQWTKAGRAGMVVSRPHDAPKWTPDQKRKFKEILDAKMSGDSGGDAGGTLIFEDGMKGERLGFNAKEEQFIEAAKLSLNTVAQVYHINPTMVGQLDNANFANVKEFRRMLYGETLGPILVQLEDRLNTFMVERISPGNKIYVEFNVKEKLRGSFEEEAQYLQAAVGGPYMTRNEARTRNNLSEVEGGDELIVPMNVTEGGQASPQDSTPDSITGEAAGPRRALKARASDTAQANTETVLRDFFKRQRKSVLSALGAKADEDWWDSERWNRELAQDLYKIGAQVANQIGRKTAQELGYDPSDYDPDQTLNFLQAVAVSRATSINAATKSALDEVLRSDPDDPDAQKPSDVFKNAEEARSVAGAAALITAFSAFATTEAAKQIAKGEKRATKTWRTNSTHPRAAHSKMNGQTVSVTEKFSNGADWPGDPSLGADGVAGCMCSVEVSIED